MSSPPQRVGSAFSELFKGDVKTRSDRWLLRLCIITGFITFAWPIFDWLVMRASPAIQDYLFAVLIVSGLTFIGSFCVLGMKAVGRAAGKRSFGAQVIYTLLRVILFVLLPCAVITALLLLWAIATDQPAFR